MTETRDNRIPQIRVDDFRILEITMEPFAAKEHKDWAIRHAGIESIPFKGKGQRVGVLDTGCDIHHCDLRKQVKGASFIRGNSQEPVWRDDCGHGTFCTGEIVAKADGHGIVGAAPEATALHCRVIYGDSRDHRRTGVADDLASAVNACVTGGCGVISMSIGGPSSSPEMREALENAVSAGVIPVAAAGNERLEGSMYASYPAAYKTVISVASANKDDLPAWFSTIGVGAVRKSAQPEVAIASLEFYWGCLPGRSTYGKMIGTSMATPLLAAVALRWREAREAQAVAGGAKMPTGEDVLKQFRKWLRRVSDDTNKNGWDPELGYGVLLLDATEMP